MFPYTDLVVFLSSWTQLNLLSFRFCKYSLQFPIWTRNGYISKQYGVFEICEKEDQLSI